MIPQSRYPNNPVSQMLLNNLAIKPQRLEVNEGDEEVADENEDDFNEGVEQDEDDESDFPNEFQSIKAFENMSLNDPSALINVAVTNKVEHKLKNRQGINEIIENQNYKGLETIKGRISNVKLDLNTVKMKD